MRKTFFYPKMGKKKPCICFVKNKSAVFKPYRALPAYERKCMADLFSFIREKHCVQFIMTLVHGGANIVLVEFTHQNGSIERVCFCTIIQGVWCPLLKIDSKSVLKYY